ncbi:MAG: enoyl-CoA hydratase/isomerase family protein [Acidobacteria bacterium]|nr:enoyl-CoA hydratase/isomerase family protein [Acidobacteriota bacterium]
MIQPIRQVAVLGAGTMGSQIAAHLANASVPCLLLDRAPDELNEEEREKSLTLSHPLVRNRFARAGIAFALKRKPPAFFTPDLQTVIEIGNFEDDLPKLTEYDWIIEAIIEHLPVKRQLMARVLPHVRTDTILSSNTSGIPLCSIAEGFSTAEKRRWLGTHFFNPPRYMRLLEIIPTLETDPSIVATLEDFCARFLGKQTVIAKDTPNFIANRIGSFVAAVCVRVAYQLGLTTEEVDTLTGPFLGRPRTAVFRMADLVGVDVLAHVAKNLQEFLPEERSLFTFPEFVSRMIGKNLLGDKSGGGFYRKDPASGEMLALDWGSLEYRALQKPRITSIEMLSSVDPVGERLQKLFHGAEDRYAHFTWETVMAALCYAAEKVPEISSTLVAIDDAMRWGFNWDLGPFQLWDQIGLRWSAEKWQGEGRILPLNVREMLDAGATHFYRNRSYWNLEGGGYIPLDRLPPILERSQLLKRNAGATLRDLGDGIACLEFQSKMNIIGPDVIEMTRVALDLLREDFEALVIGNDGEHFSAGANLMLLLLEIQEGNWDDIDRMVRMFQQMTHAIKFAPKPVVAAPFSLTLGGGAEICLASRFCQPFAELYMGLVETGVGLIPAGGGTKELFLRNLDLNPTRAMEDAVKRTFEVIALAKVSQSAQEAQTMNFIAGINPVTMQRSRLVEDAKRLALYLASQAYRPPLERKDLPAAGTNIRAMLELGIHLKQRAEFISEHDGHIGRKLAWVLCGGGRDSGKLSEQDMLDLEREAFLSLCGERKTQERIQHMLKTGKPLRN